jgi:alpha-tubulin suppressor-like RCC1 family protein
MFSFGLNDQGQLGDGSLVTKNTPIVVAAGEMTGTIVNVVSRSKHVLVLSNNGVTYSWGSNSHGQLGVSSDDLFRSTPSRVYGNPGVITHIGVGSRHSVIYNTRLFVYSFGDNAKGELGQGSTSTITTIRAPGDAASIVGMIRKDWEWIIDIQGGDGYTIILTDKFRVYGWGKNTNGQLGDGTTTDAKDGVKIETLERTSIKERQVQGIVAGENHVLMASSTFQILPCTLFIILSVFISMFI